MLETTLATNKCTIFTVFQSRGIHFQGKDLGRYKNGETGELVHGIFNRCVMIDGNV